VLLPNEPDRDGLSVRVGDRDPEDPFRLEDPEGVVAERSVTEVRELGF